MRSAALAVVCFLAACSDPMDVPGHDALITHVEGKRIGGDADHWIEMKNLAGEWEKTGLIFGYIGDYDECLNAIAGMKKVNYAREYRCTPAHQAQP